MRPSRSRSAAVLASLALAGAAVCPPLAGQTRTLDDFASVTGWVAAPSDGVKLRVAEGTGFAGGGLRLDFDFQGGGGYAIARKTFDLPLPENYEFAFRIRGDGPVNDLEFKLVDSTGDNVWWHVHRAFEFPAEWTSVVLKRRQIRFAWGPAGGGELDHVGAIEIVITARTGGTGTVWIDDLTLTPREPVRPYDAEPAAGASAARGGYRAANVLDGDTATAWRTRARAGAWLALDFLQSREYGGLVIDWAAGSHAVDYVVETSPDGKAWSKGRRVTGSDGGRDYVYLPETESRWVRLRLLRAAGREFAVTGVAVQPLAWSESRSAFFHAIAREAPRGTFPKYLADSVQSYWTVVGPSGARDEALINEEGALEPRPGGWSAEPFLALDGRLVSWADVTTAQSLADGYLPIPGVAWRGAGASLDVTAWPVGVRDSSAVIARYRVTNPTGCSITPTLYVAIRPFQVNPTWQFLNTPGGAARIRALAFDGSAVRVNGDVGVVPITPPAAFGAATFDGGGIVPAIRRGELPSPDSLSDPLDAASGALAFPLSIPAGEWRDVYVAFPFSAGAPLADVARDPAASLAASSRRWREELGRVTFSLPAAAEPIAATLRSTLAYILVNRDGPAIQPGSRAYARSWIRDGALTAAAMLRLGHADEAREFVEWFAPYQYPSGKVPCCVDSRGADPVPENDSHGELIYIVAETFRFTDDTAFLRTMWPRVEGAVSYIDSLRQSRRTGEYRQPEKTPFFGLLPESISHEGYSAKPMHSYWDDFFALRGLKDAVEIAAALGHGDALQRFTAIRNEFSRDLYRSLDATIARHGIDYIPGSVELGDYDPTSTTIAIAPGGELANLPAEELEHTFDRYFRAAIARRDSTAWDAYTPYELRAVGTLVRLGRPDRAHALLDALMADRRPPGWNHWAEVVWREPGTPKFIGDMPHTWVGSDFIRSVLDFFAYEREADSALVVGAGIPAAWLSAGDSIGVGGLRTRYGALGYTMARVGGKVRIRLTGGIRVPPGGIRVLEPFEGERPRREAVVRRLPAEVAF